MTQTEKPKVKKAPAHLPKKGTRAQVFSFTGDDGKKYSLTLQQKNFCELFCQYSMNGVDAIIEAGYNVDNRSGNPDRKLAAHMAHENLLKPNIGAYITTLLDEYGLNDDNVDKQLNSLINQNAELSAKARGIDMYFKKKGSYAPEKHQTDFSEKVEEALDRLSKVLPDTGV